MQSTDPWLKVIVTQTVNNTQNNILAFLNGTLPVTSVQRAYSTILPHAVNGLVEELQPLRGVIVDYRVIDRLFERIFKTEFTRFHDELTTPLEETLGQLSFEEILDRISDLEDVYKEHQLYYDASINTWAAILKTIPDSSSCLALHLESVKLD